MKTDQYSLPCWAVLTVFLLGYTTFDYDSTESTPEVGWCSYVSNALHGQPTASGELYNKSELTAAHRSYPFGTRLRVTNLHNGEEVVVRVNDRGPYVADRIIDVSLEAARELNFVERGVVKVRVEVVDED